MTRSFACRDAGLVCSTRIRADSDAEVLRKAVEHAREKHGVDLLQARSLARYAESVITDDSAPEPTRGR